MITSPHTETSHFMSQPQAPWYREGLNFECTRCGHCCTGAPGYVWVSLEDISTLSQHLGLTLDAFGKQYLRQLGGRLSLVEKPGGDCIFWSRDTGCTVYEARPIQCRTWPFWPENVESPADWERTQRSCPGSRRGRLYSLGEIEHLSRRADEVLE
jgi:Fe-S-cluster containining protein